MIVMRQEGLIRDLISSAKNSVDNLAREDKEFGFLRSCG